MISILAAILIFGVIVFIHELGHFLLAKLNGIGVVEFSIGMGPRLVSTVRDETRYSIKALPFGGSCMMLGEDAEEQDEKAFNNKSVLARISVIAAGPVFNFILAFICAVVLVQLVGCDRPVINGVREGFPAQAAGLQAGDKIIKVNNRKVFANRDLSMYLMSHPGESLILTFERPLDGGGKELKQVMITPQQLDDKQTYMIGVEFQSPQKTESLPELFSASAYEVKFCITSTFDSFRMIFNKQIKVDEAVAGPVRIVTMVGENVEANGRSGGAVAVLYAICNWSLMLSASLGLMNLLPIPALDGGRLLFLFLELLRGKPVDPDKEGMIHMAGMMVLMTLMVLVLVNDIRNLF